MITYIDADCGILGEQFLKVHFEYTPEELPNPNCAGQPEIIDVLTVWLDKNEPFKSFVDITTLLNSDDLKRIGELVLASIKKEGL